MKVTLYAVKQVIHPSQSSQSSQSSYPSCSWKWYFSLDMAVDKQYWSNREGSSSMIYITPRISLGWADVLKAELSFATGRVTYHVDELVMERWIQCLCKKGSELGLNNRLMQNLIFKKVNLRRTIDLETTIDPNIMIKLSHYLQGRSLLQEELLDSLAFLGIAQISNHWRSYIQALYLQGDIEILNGVACEFKSTFPLFKRKKIYHCRRCGCGQDKMFGSYCVSCDSRCPYCEECLNMGRARFCSILIHGNKGSSHRYNGHAKITQAELILAKTTQADTTQPLRSWSLSPVQTEAASAGLKFLNMNSQLHKKTSVTNSQSYHRLNVGIQNEPPCFLIWAVTGAGKTEMIFPLIEDELFRGGKVLLATPRKDVVIELQPRLQKAFPHHSLVTLYGGSSQRWDEGDITLATTHQLLRFWRRFDLIIIDELDAYPFQNNPMLEYAARKACTALGRYILLSATPPGHLQQAVKRNKLPHARVSVRYHRHPLPVPRRFKMKSLKNLCGSFSSNRSNKEHSTLNESNKKDLIPKKSHGVFCQSHNRSIPRPLYRELKASIDRGAQIFLFVPKIKYISTLLQLLRNTFMQILIEGTSSQDPDRATKVQDFRTGDIRLLVTTTILERGITVPKTDVFVLDADSELFDEAALVQMAGRSGRASSDPQGRVYFFAQDKTRSQIKAVNQIIGMNRLARKKGYLIAEKEA